MKLSITRDWRRGARQAAFALGIASGATALATLGAGYYAVRSLTGAHRSGPMDGYTVTPFETGVPYEDVSFAPPRGDYTLQAWWLPRPETARVIVASPGYRADKSQLVGIGSALWRAGFNVLVFDYNGHGSNRGIPVTLGYRELADFFGALNFARQRIPGARIGALGYSMGAAITIMGVARRADVQAVVADSPFATHTDVVNHKIEQAIHLPARPVATVADLLLPLVAGYHASDVAPVLEVAAIAPRPLLLIHGTADREIPVSHAYQMYEAAGEPKQLWLGEGADHCGAYFLDRPTYCQRVAQFFVSALGPAEAAPSPAQAASTERLTHP